MSPSKSSGSKKRKIFFFYTILCAPHSKLFNIIFDSINTLGLTCLIYVRSTRNFYLISIIMLSNKHAHHYQLLLK